MHVVTTNSAEWIDGTNTAIRIEFDDDAKQEADAWSGPNERMLDRCAWRLLHERRDEISGEAVCFTVSREEILKLIDALRSIESAST